MYIHIHIYIYIYIYIYTFTYLYFSLSIYLYMYVYISLSLYIYIYIYIYVMVSGTSKRQCTVHYDCGSSTNPCVRQTPYSSPKRGSITFVAFSFASRQALTRPIRQRLRWLPPASVFRRHSVAAIPDLGSSSVGKIEQQQVSHTHPHSHTCTRRARTTRTRNRDLKCM